MELVRKSTNEAELSSADREHEPGSAEFREMKGKHTRNLAHGRSYGMGKMVVSGLQN